MKMKAGSALQSQVDFQSAEALAKEMKCSYARAKLTRRLRKKVVFDANLDGKNVQCMHSKMAGRREGSRSAPKLQRDRQGAFEPWPAVRHLLHPSQSIPCQIGVGFSSTVGAE